MAEREEGIWSGDAGELARRRAQPGGLSLTLPGQQGSEWGLAALLTASACMILCPLALLVWVGLFHADFWSWSDRRHISVVLVACQFIAFGLTAMCLAFAIVGLTAARRQQTPVALPLTALVVSGVTLVFWIIILVCTILDATS
jgi:hypothetical protein